MSTDLLNKEEREKGSRCLLDGEKIDVYIDDKWRPAVVIGAERDEEGDYLIYEFTDKSDRDVYLSSHWVRHGGIFVDRVRRSK